MYKKYKNQLTILLISFILLSCLPAKHIAAQAFINPVGTNNNVNLILDSLNYNDMPKNFRKSSTSITTPNNNNLNLNGLNNLNISGSAQFSEYNLPLVLKQIATSLPITVIDLRQECHGFINGLPVSWSNSKNNSNMGLTKEQVLSDESNKLASIKLNTPITFYNAKNMTIVPTKVESENELVNSKSLSYVRIPVTDGKLPTDEMVDYFVQFVKSQPKNTWLHFHCKHGVGRTTTFMIMYDIMKNYNQVALQDIINRQVALLNFDQQKIESIDRTGRNTFLQNFYKYCKENGDDFNIKWSDWEKTSTNQ